MINHFNLIFKCQLFRHAFVDFFIGVIAQLFIASQIVLTFLPLSFLSGAPSFPLPQPTGGQEEEEQEEEEEDLEAAAILLSASSSEAAGLRAVPKEEQRKLDPQESTPQAQDPPAAGERRKKSKEPRNPAAAKDDEEEEEQGSSTLVSMFGASLSPLFSCLHVHYCVKRNTPPCFQWPLRK